MKKTFFYLLPVLIGISGYSQTVLEFNYDVSGNQTLRHIATSANAKNSIASDSIAIPASILSELSIENIENQFVVSPNPTSGLVQLSWLPELDELITRIELVSLISSETIPIQKVHGNTTSIDLSGKITGVYLINFYLDDSIIEKVQKKIIKY